MSLVVRGVWLAALALLVVALALAAHAEHDITKKIAASVTEKYKATGVVCTPEGMVHFPRGDGRWTVYDCLIRGSDPDLLYAEQIRSSPFRRCYAYAGQPVDVTGYLREILSSGQLRGGESTGSFPCVTDHV